MQEAPGELSGVNQAERQLRAAAGVRVEWVFAERRAMEAVLELFRDNPVLQEAIETGQFALRVR